MAKVSVVIPCYNGIPYLVAAIESVQAQTLTDWELICVDDGSTDQSWALAQGYAGRDARIKVVRNEQNLGMVGNWNRACELATSPYVKLLCADDVLYPDALKGQVEILEAHPKVGLVTSASLVINSQGQPLLTRRPMGVKRGQPPRILTAQETLAACIAGSANLMGEPSIVMFRRELFAPIGKFNSDYKYGTDLEFYLRLLIKGQCDMAVSSEITAGFRLHPGSLTNTHMTRGADELAKIFQAAVQECPQVLFDAARFSARYLRQTRIKGHIIACAENPLGVRILRLVDRARMAAL